jgi:hypothetical protein
MESPTSLVKGSWPIRSCQVLPKSRIEIGAEMRRFQLAQIECSGALSSALHIIGSDDPRLVILNMFKSTHMNLIHQLAN